MNVFKCEAYGAVVVAFNRGHACKLLGKALEAKGIVLDKKDKVEKIDVDTAGVVAVDVRHARPDCSKCNKTILMEEQWELLQESLSFQRTMRENACTCE